MESETVVDGCLRLDLKPWELVVVTLERMPGDDEQG